MLPSLSHHVTLRIRQLRHLCLLAVLLTVFSGLVTTSHIHLDRHPIDSCDICLQTGGLQAMVGNTLKLPAPTPEPAPTTEPSHQFIPVITVFKAIRAPPLVFSLA